MSFPQNPPQYSVKTGNFYYHFKHNPEKGVTDYAYKIIGLAVHSETEEILVVYKPFYSSNHVYDLGADFYTRPLSIFLELMDKAEIGYKGPRFILISDLKIIAKLQEIDLLF